MKQMKIGVVVGSVRRDSFNKKAALAVASMLPDGFEAEFLEIGDLPMFNQDYDDDGQTPPQWTAFRQKVREMDGFLFCTPEYNRSIPPVFKNALDIASRPNRQNCWDSKPGALLSVSPGKFGGFGASMHARQVLFFLNINLMNQPEAYIGGAADVFAEDGTVKSEKTAALFQSIATALADWCRKWSKD